MQGLLRIRFPVDPSKSEMRGQHCTFSLASPVVAILRRSSAGVCYSQFSIALSTMPSSAAEADTLHPYLISRIRILILSLQVCFLLFFHRIISPASSPVPCTPQRSEKVHRGVQQSPSSTISWTIPKSNLAILGHPKRIRLPNPLCFPSSTT
jgi:hypothetical protein